MTRRRAGVGAVAAGVLAVVIPATRAQESPPPSPPPSPPSAPREAVVTSLTVFAGTSGGLYRSRDWGNSWQPAVKGENTFGLDGVGAVRDVVPVGPHVLLGGDGGVYLSDDFGLTWRRTETGAPVARVLPSRYPTADLTVFAATASGLLKSGDAGRTFAPTVLTGTPVYRLEWPGPALVAATGRGVLVSMDSGTTFTAAEAGLPAGDVRALAVSTFFAIDPVLFAGVGAHGVYRSGDRGRTWKPAGLEGETVTDLAWLGPFLYAVTGNGVFRSEDMGQVWNPLKKGLDKAPTRVLFPLMPVSGMEVFLGTMQGVYRSPDGGAHWQPSGLQDQAVLCLATFPQQDMSRSR
ncbi:MAG TPA: hypothetical protein VFO85_03585, partial [Vicinamibacteria bacterium]|nr:hypothetical protein [Vicinamibacteria bacterium]